MLKLLCFLSLLHFCTSFGQGNFLNTGNLKIFEQGQMGFHCDVRNDGNFDQNLGMAGFYGPLELFLSGNRKPVFYDLEIFSTASLHLGISVAVRNNLNFIEGNIETPRNAPDIRLELDEGAFYTGASDASKLDGRLAMKQIQDAHFPVGDSNSLRSLDIFSEEVNDEVAAAYFREDPNFPASLPGRFPTSAKAQGLLDISTREFWEISGQVPSVIRLSWDAESNLGSLVSSIDELTVTGWNIEESRWENLGNSVHTGDLRMGTVSTVTCIPDLYAMVTFGKAGPGVDMALENYLLTPNNDGLNDVLIIQVKEDSGGIRLRVFNQYGILVYSCENYTNEFKGISNRNNVLRPNAGLAAGVYFYIATQNDSGISHQGYLYISN